VRFRGEKGHFQHGRAFSMGAPAPRSAGDGPVTPGAGCGGHYACCVAVADINETFCFPT